MNSEISKIFYDLRKENQDINDNFLQNAIAKTEDETKFILTGKVNVTTEAEKEIEELKQKIKILKGKQRKFKNHKNHKKTNVNSKRKEGRKKIKLEIAECQLRIEEISKEIDSFHNNSI